MIAGSANFTYAGLTQNLELVLGRYDTPASSERARRGSTSCGKRRSRIDLAALYEARFEPHSPYSIYLRMLWER